MFLTGKGSRKNKNGGAVYKAGRRLSVLTARQLLKTKEHQLALEHIKKLVDLPDEYWEYFYLKLIEDFAEFVQLIPLSPNDYLGSLLNESLTLAYATLYQLRQDPTHLGLKKAHVSPLLTYAVFTAALLVNVTAVLVHQRVFITTEDGTKIDTWNPFKHKMSAVGPFYKLYFRTGAYGGTQYALTVLLVRQLLPSEGFEWLSNDENLFNDWLNALRGESELEGRIITELNAAKELLKTPLGEPLGLPYVDIDQLQTLETQLGEAFVEWLGINISAKKIKVNASDASVHRVIDGVFLEDPKVFQQFVDQYGANATVKAVREQFAKIMGIQKLNNDFLQTHFRSEYSHIRGINSNAMSYFGLNARPPTTQTGFVITDSSIIFRGGEVVNITQYLQLMPGMTNAHHRLPSLPTAQPPLTLHPTPSPEKKGS